MFISYQNNANHSAAGTLQSAIFLLCITFVLFNNSSLYATPINSALISDNDGDTISDNTDNCPTTPNSAQLDYDFDGKGDACDNDDDNDNLLDIADNCPWKVNSLQLDIDVDGVGNVCDSDIDGDTVLNKVDNCRLVSNIEQMDSNADGVGDVCVGDKDGDFIQDVVDNCPFFPNTNQQSNCNLCIKASKYDPSLGVYIVEEKCTVSFVDIAPSLGININYSNYGPFWADFNNDSLTDLVYMGHGLPPMLLKQVNGGQFQNVISTSGIKTSNFDYAGQRDRHGGSCADFNNDGNIDFFIAHGANSGNSLGVKYDELLLGLGDFSFLDVTHSAGTLNSYGRSRTGNWVDYNNDGWIDLYINNFDSSNVMYKNNGDGSFSDVTDITGLGLFQYRSAWSDYDKDGYADLISTWPIKLMRNNRAGGFYDATEQLGIGSTVFGYDIAWFDYDNDGDQDLFIGGIDKNSSFFINTNGILKRTTNIDWHKNAGVILNGISPGDFDNDGDLDLFQVRSDGYFLFINNGNKTFEMLRIGNKVPNIARGGGDPAIEDFNQDGLLDIAIDDDDGYVLLKNQTISNLNWLKINFSGTQNNRMGFGNKIWISVGGKFLAYREYMGANTGLSSIGCNPIHFGLGLNKTVDITVMWPNGQVTFINAVNSNQSIVVTDSKNGF